QIEESRLAATGLTDDGDDFLRRDGEIEAVDGDDRLARRRLAEHLAQGPHFDRQRRFHARHRNRRCSTRATAPSSRNRSATSTMVQAKTSATENNSCATDN